MPPKLPEQDVDRNFRPLATRLQEWKARVISVPTDNPLLFTHEIDGQVFVVIKNIGTFNVWVKETNQNVIGDSFVIRPNEKEDLFVTNGTEIYLQAEGGVSNVCVRVHGYRSQSLVGG